MWQLDIDWQCRIEAGPVWAFNKVFLIDNEVLRERFSNTCNVD